MWQPLEMFGETFGRVRRVAFAPHRPATLLVWADNGLFSVWYFRTASVSKEGTAAEADAHFDPATGKLAWHGVVYTMHGDGLDTYPAAAEHPGGDRLEPHPETDSLHVTDAAGAWQQTIHNFRPAYEAWALATFFDNFSMLLVAAPSGVRLFKYYAAKGAERPRWTAAAGEQQKQLFQAVLANPDEDTPRLMYADWLDEHGDAARAEFIRVQCRLAERWHAEFVPPSDPDQSRESALQRQMEARWLAELPAVRGVHWAGFHRGFAGVRVGSPTTLVRAAKKLFAAAPVDAVTVEDLTQAGADALADSPVLGRIRHLTLDRYHVPRDGVGPLRRVLHAAAAAGLLSLTMRSSYLTDEGVRVVAASPHLTGLEWLNVSYGAVGDATAGVLLASPALGRLRGGPFRGNNLSGEAKARLKARFPWA